MALPTLSTATVSPAGNELVLVFDAGGHAPMTLTDTTGLTLTVGSTERAIALPATVDGSTVTVTIDGLVYSGQEVTLDYDDTSGDVANSNAEALASFSSVEVTNNSAVDSSVPTITAATLDTDGTSIALTFDAGNGPMSSTDNSGFTLTVDGSELLLTGTPSGSGLQLTLTASATIADDAEVFISYDAATGDLADGTPLNVASFTNFPVTNNSASDRVDLVSATLNDDRDRIVVVWDVPTEPVLPATDVTGFSVTVNGNAVTPSSVARSSATNMNINFDDALPQNADIRLSYDDGTGNVADSDAATVKGFSDVAVTANWRTDRVSTVASSRIDGERTAHAVIVDITEGANKTSMLIGPRRFEARVLKDHLIQDEGRVYRTGRVAPMAYVDKAATDDDTKSLRLFGQAFNVDRPGNTGAVALVTKEVSHSWGASSYGGMIKVDSVYLPITSKKEFIFAKAPLGEVVDRDAVYFMGQSVQIVRLDTDGDGIANTGWMLVVCQ